MPKLLMEVVDGEICCEILWTDGLEIKTLAEHQSAL